MPLRNSDCKKKGVMGDLLILELILSFFFFLVVLHWTLSSIKSLLLIFHQNFTIRNTNWDQGSYPKSFTFLVITCAIVMNYNVLLSIIESLNSIGVDVYY